MAVEEGLEAEPVAAVDGPGGPEEAAQHQDAEGPGDRAVRDLFERLGFTPDPDFTPPAEAPETLGFRLDLAGYAPRPTRIAVRRTGIPQVSEGPRSSEGIPA